MKEKFSLLLLMLTLFFSTAFPKTNQLQVYPNPANNYLNIASDKMLNAVTIFDFSGKKLIYKNDLSNQENILDLSSLKKGVYFIQLTTVDNTTLLKFTKQ